MRTRARLLQMGGFVLAAFLGAQIAVFELPWMVSAQAPPVGGNKRLGTAAVNKTLSGILNDFGLAIWPKFAADPATCNAGTEAAYYFNTTSSTFLICDGSSWTNSGVTTTELNDLTDVFVSSPADNEVLRYDGVTDNRWENGAAAASALDDLSDVEAPGPSDGDILVYDGVTDNRWETLAGAAPTTFAALSDTNIAGTADRDKLRWDGSDWVNEVDHVSVPYHYFPNQYFHGSNSTSQIVNADNQVKAFCFNFYTRCEVDRVIWRTNTVTSCTAGLDGSVALFSQDGNTKILDTGAQDYNGAGADAWLDVDVTDTQVEVGTYYVTYTQSEGNTSSCSVHAILAPTGTDDSIDLLGVQIGSHTCAPAGTAANPSVAAAMPATLGVVTANTGVNRPLIAFICK